MNTPARDLPLRYDAVAMTLHWLIAALIIANVAIALSAEDMPRPDAMAWMGWHKAIGLSVLVLSVIRIVWRLVNPMPAPIGDNRRDRAIAAATQQSFYLLMILVPLAGWLLVSSYGRPVPFFGLFQIPAIPGLVPEYGNFFGSAHGLLAFAMMGLLLLHVAAGLMHHVKLKDNTLLRMLPFTRLRGGT